MPAASVQLHPGSVPGVTWKVHRAQAAAPVFLPSAGAVVGMAMPATVLA